MLHSAATVVMMNVVMALLAGLAIFSAVFSFDIEPEAGPGLLFAVWLLIIKYIAPIVIIIAFLNVLGMF